MKRTKRAICTCIVANKKVTPLKLRKRKAIYANIFTPLKQLVTLPRSSESKLHAKLKHDSSQLTLTLTHLLFSGNKESGKEGLRIYYS